MNTPLIHTSLPKGIMIIGAAKSGTTALFYAVQNTLQKRFGLHANGLFEPTQSRKVKHYLQHGGDDVMLIKMLMGPFIRKELGLFEDFDKKIIIFRDPRDNVISRLVFMLKKLFELSQRDQIDEVIQLLRRKEQDPECLSVVAILNEISRIAGREALLDSMRSNAVLPARMKREAGDEYFLFAYDDFVEGKFAQLNGYLGFDLDPQFQVDDRHSYVVRTKSSGDWKDWFLQEDIDYFVTEVADDYRELGFDVDQKSNAIKTIDPKSCSEYALAQFVRLRDKRKERKARKESALEPEEKRKDDTQPPVMLMAEDDNSAEQALIERMARRKRRTLRHEAVGKSGELDG